MSFIMDEASQLRLEDAIPALARGTQFIIAGDSQQLPPSNYFFQTEDDEVEFEEETMSDVKSLLELPNQLKSIRQYQIFTMPLSFLNMQN